jgi:TolA-binding protein
MKKSFHLLLWFSVCCAATSAEQIDSCAGLDGPALVQCRTNQQTLRQQERLEQQLQQQEDRQIQLDKQQKEVQLQLESMRLQNESLRQQLERGIAIQSARSQATDPKQPTSNADLKSWRADNPWFGTDYPKTQFAMRYLKQLQLERPDLAGRELLDALSTKVDEKFGAKH